MQKYLKIGVFALGLIALTASSAYAREGVGNVEKVENKVAKTLVSLESKLERGQDWVMKSAEEARSVILKADGGFQVRGAEVVSVNVSGSTITAKLYGFTKEVSVAGAKISAVGGSSVTLADFKAGDKVAAWGTFDENTKAIKVSELRNITVRSQANAAIQARIDELLKMIRELQEKIKAGVR